MAEFLEELFGQSLRAAFKDLWRAVATTSEVVVECFREVATPPPNLHLESEDGCTFTGVVLVERSVAVALLAVRHPAPRASLRERSPTGPRFDLDDAFWQRPSSPRP